MSNISSILACTAVLGGTFLCGSAQAAISFVGSSDGDFGSVDTETGVFSRVGNTGLSFFDIAILDDSTGYGVADGGEFFSINLADASTTLLGHLNGFVNGLGFDDSGNLFGTGGDRLFEIDIDRAKANLVAEIDGFNSAGDIAYDGDKFFLTSDFGPNNTLFSINADGSNASSIGNVGVDNVFGLTYQDNQLLGFTEGNQVIEIDQSTGAGRQILSLSGVTGDILGAAPAPAPAPVRVPEPGMAFALVALGIVGFRKRKQGSSAQT